MTAAPSAVGIDLGTTNTSLAWVRLDGDPEPSPEALAIPQLVAPGEVARRPLLPSFVYLPGSGEVSADLLRLPWSDEPPTFAVGSWAQSLASERPGQVVSSAKSWLLSEGIDRRAPVLPWDREPVPRQISPVAALSLVLEHLAAAWAAGPGQTLGPLAEQDVYLTVPASFDAVARELTVEAAEAAGLPVTLIEEPQAAFYAWMHDVGDGWRDHLGVGEVALVCDLGGGTTDFSLIQVQDAGGALELERIAVGEHILLGGDNMDLALAYGVAQRLADERGIRLDGHQLAGLTHACRRAKERLGEGAETQPLTVLGRGSSLVGGTIRTELDAAELEARLLDGFFPVCELDERPRERRRIGFRTFGLDYATDPAVTRHLAEFLVRHAPRIGGDPVLPATVLFNGGVTRSPLLRERIVGALAHWQGQRPRVLAGTSPDLAVAMGAAVYGRSRHSGGFRIRAGSARSYYVGIESSRPAVPGFEPPIEVLCVVPFGMEEGSSAEVPASGLGLLVGAPTEFRFFTSTERREDELGTVLPDGRELEELVPLVVDLPAGAERAEGALVPVRLETVLTAVGTLEVWGHEIAGDGRWRLQLELQAR